ncbi:MAG: YggU family protein [Methanomassiliicoccales archaeon]|nr:MAG: YggU family protein [Methanomassiliicoccales archaeon]
MSRCEGLSRGYALTDGVGISDAVRTVAQGSEVDVVVSPNAKKCSIGEVDPWRKRLVIKVTAPPEGGRANREVEGLLSEMLKTKATIVSGHTARSKTVFVPLPPSEVMAKLGDR